MSDRRIEPAFLPGLPTGHGPLPQFAVQLQPPDLSPWRQGNTGLPGIMRFESAEPGPNVVVSSLMHGNEIAGAIVLDALLRDGIRPLRGSLTFGFLNLAAFDRFDAADPTASRFVHEDMNRVWDRAILDGSRDNAELARARALRPLFDRADILLDLHSMLWPSEPLILSGGTEKGRNLAASLDTPNLVVADGGHRSGPRLIDYAPFADPQSRPTACLVEAGPHWHPDTVDTTRIAVLSLLRRLGMVAAQPPLPGPAPRTRFATVTEAVTARTSQFEFVRTFRGGDVIEREGTLIARDGATQIRTPHPDCLLVMPSLRPSRGHTAVRLARLA
ncbi:succinylglutamate desuccinylase/aspartoacylase family protein [Acetobacteraceae bacterium KSS8]|uniref:Succinylglutamate desuccinylase/aspartoacylase family protein n=1 Tax=Endosaccharibacter trunci TaxID=2812733 RepID=A0ABT1W7E3_9PROT|nr:succinylglutamate desuccinylase/aspartoacylase family protein [Acetobacteraceae bacterium KSS8]